MISSDSSGQDNILRHDGDSVSMDGTEIGVLEESNKVWLGGFLEGQNGWGLESHVGLAFRGELSNKSLEWEFSDQKVSRLLELSDLSDSNGTWSESVWLLDSASLSNRLLGGSLASGFSSNLLWSDVWSVDSLSSCHILL